MCNVCVMTLSFTNRKAYDNFHFHWQARLCDLSASVRVAEGVV